MKINLNMTKNSAGPTFEKGPARNKLGMALSPTSSKN